MPAPTPEQREYAHLLLDRAKSDLAAFRVLADGDMLDDVVGFHAQQAVEKSLKSPTRIRPNRPFDPWWIEPVTKDQAGALFSRKDYVLTASNKEGGAHVDHKLDAAYSALSKDNTLGWAYTLDEEASRPLDRNPAFASIRQIAYEGRTDHSSPSYKGWPPYMTDHLVAAPPPDAG